MYSIRELSKLVKNPTFHERFFLFAMIKLFLVLNNETKKKDFRQMFFLFLKGSSNIFGKKRKEILLKINLMKLITVDIYMLA